MNVRRLACHSDPCSSAMSSEPWDLETAVVGMRAYSTVVEE